MKLNNFAVHELVPKDVYKDRGEKAIQLMDRELLTFIDKLRTHLGRSITVNNWQWGGPFQYRGLRDANSDVYSKYSQHSFGKALDFDVDGMTAEEVRQWIIDNRLLSWVRPITFIEDGVSWVHVDTRPTHNDSLVSWHVKTGKAEVYER